MPSPPEQRGRAADLPDLPGLPVQPPLTPMLAKAVPEVPDGDLWYEPKWDGFRALVWRSGPTLEITSRGERPLTRYFPEIVEAGLDLLPDHCVLDGEIILRRSSPAGEAGERLDWDALSQRIHPAASRVRLLAEQTPASLVVFDALVLAGDSLLAEPFRWRRELLERALSGVSAPLHLTRGTRDSGTARTWFNDFEGAGLDGVVCKPQEGTYQPGVRAMLKVKHSRTAECVVIGYRPHRGGRGVGSLLLGLYDGDRLRMVGGVGSLPDRTRAELVDTLAPYRLPEEQAAALPAPPRSRFASGPEQESVPLRPELVVEVRYDQVEAGRFRHTVALLRWRPDRDPASCRIDQLDPGVSYDLSQVLGTAPSG